jgi:hypothetical protein
MALKDFYPISQNENGDTNGLVWSGVVQPEKYFAELQTGILPQLVHLVIFDLEDDYKPVYTTLQAFQVGDTMTAEKMEELQVAIGIGLAELNA